MRLPSKFINLVLFLFKKTRKDQTLVIKYFVPITFSFNHDKSSNIMLLF